MYDLGNNNKKGLLYFFQIVLYNFVISPDVG